MKQICLLALAPWILSCDGGEASASLPIPPGATRIADVQGPGAESPLDGKLVTLVGIVSGDFQNDDDSAMNLGGFFMQDESYDRNATPSAGLFVYDGMSPTVDVNPGDRVRVTGTVQEHFGETQLAADQVEFLSAGTVEPIMLELPFETTTLNSEGELVPDLERYEGMLVQLPQTLTITELYNLERYGAIRLSQSGRLYQFTNVSAPDADDYNSHRVANAARSIELDDGRRDNNVKPIRYLEAHGDAIRIGDTVSNVIGHLRYSRGSGGNGKETWRLMPRE